MNKKQKERDTPNQVHLFKGTLQLVKKERSLLNGRDMGLIQTLSLEWHEIHVCNLINNKNSNSIFQLK